VKPILSVGALTADTIFRLDALPLKPGKFIPTEAVEVTGGMASSQAASAARLGASVKLWASVGDDARGAQLIAEISREGVDCSAVRKVAGARSAFSTILVDAHGERIIVPRYDPQLIAAPDALPDIDFSSLSLVMTDVRWPGAAALALTAAREAGIPGILDADVATPETLALLVPLASHVVASEPAAQMITGLDQAESAAASLAVRLDAFVAVTAGAQGSYWSDRGQGSVEYTPAFEVAVVDTLAAGDAFHAGFAVGLAEGMASAQIMRFASAVAAIKCTRFGGRIGAPLRAEVEAFLAAR
jgi:sulfofructose kinase